MVAQLENVVLDAALNEIDLATTITICSAEPTTFNEANNTFKLGSKVFGAGAVFGAASNATPSGRKVTSVAVTNGSVSATGTASWYAIIDGSRLLAKGQLASAQAVTSGGTFTLAPFDVTILAHQ